MNPGYYTQHAAAYAHTTRTVDMAPLYARFLPHVPAGGLILDAGCGSGRDALAFLQQGYAVEAFDASPELAQLASQHAGIPVKVMRFQDFRLPGATPQTGRVAATEGGGRLFARASSSKVGQRGHYTLLRSGMAPG